MLEAVLDAAAAAAAATTTTTAAAAVSTTTAANTTTATTTTAVSTTTAANNTAANNTVNTETEEKSKAGERMSSQRERYLRQRCILVVGEPSDYHADLEELIVAHVFGGGTAVLIHPPHTLIHRE